MSRKVCPRITKFYTDIHTDPLHSNTGMDDTNYFLLEVIAKKISKMPHPIASDGIYAERFKQGSSDFTQLLETIGRIHALDMTLLAASGRLQNAIEYCTKVRKNDSGRQRIG